MYVRHLGLYVLVCFWLVTTARFLLRCIGVYVCSLGRSDGELCLGSARSPERSF